MLLGCPASGGKRDDVRIPTIPNMRGPLMDSENYGCPPAWLGFRTLRDFRFLQVPSFGRIPAGC